MNRFSRGFTYLWVLILIAALSIGLAAAGEIWSSVACHQKSAQTQWVVEQVERALASYRAATPIGQRKALPSTTELIEDRRGAVVLHHLRFSVAQMHEPIIDIIIKSSEINASDGGVIKLKEPFLIDCTR